MPSHQSSLLQLCGFFLRLGATAFGGPAAHIALMHNEVVVRRKWLTDAEFLDLVGATNLIPGPNSTEMAMHIGRVRAGWPGLFAAGICFMAPAVIIVTLLAWLYVRFGSTPQMGWLLYGVKPVVIAIILHALWSLGRKAIVGWWQATLAILVIAAYLLGINEIALLFIGGLAAMIIRNWKKVRGKLGTSLFVPIVSQLSLAAGPATFNQAGMFLTLLKIGAVWYGSGYVLIAFLRSEFVERLAWVTDQQLMDAIAVGQITPGPIFTAATFTGYLLDGTTGAGLATLAICLPSFVFVAISGPLIPRIRKSVFAGSFLDGVNVAALGLMAAVTWQIGKASITDPLTIIVAVMSAVALFRFRLNSLWLVLGGAIVGFIGHLLSVV